MNELTRWLIESPEPWTRYRTWLDLLGQVEDVPEVQAARGEMVAHPLVQGLIATAAAFPERPIKRHNDASHPIYALSTLADFGLHQDDPGMAGVVADLLSHQSTQGAFQSLVNIPQAFGGSGEDRWAWVACDAPTLLYALLSFGLKGDPRLQRASEHLSGLVGERGWGCAAVTELGKFRGPGRKTDPCPVANLFALKALSQIPEMLDSPAAHLGVEMLLDHWAAPPGRKYFLFGVGSDFRKFKYPFVWYDLLHVAEVLSHYPQARADPRFLEMVRLISSQADESGRFTATSMYHSWKGWSFADKKNPSPWLTFLAQRIDARARRPVSA